MDRIGLPFPWGIVPAERLFRVVVGDDPAAGAEASVTVPGGVVWEVKTFTVSLAASAAVADRSPHLVADDGATTLGEFPTAANITANITGRITWANLGAANVNGGILDGFTGTIPQLFLLAGFRVRTRTQNLQALDNYTAPTLYVAEYEIRGLERGVAKYLEALARAGAEG